MEVLGSSLFLILILKIYISRLEKIKDKMNINISKFFLLIFLFTSNVYSQYFSQFEQDKFLNEKFFKNKKNGVFIDIGAHNGINLSNTYFFEKKLNWRGI